MRKWPMTLKYQILHSDLFSIYRTNQDHGKEQPFERIKHLSVLYSILVVVDKDAPIIHQQDDMF